MAIKTISQFPSGIPADNDYILFEQNGEGKSCSIKNLVLNNIYPVGSIYISLNPTSPAELFGGNWSPIKDVFLLAAGDTYQVTTKLQDGGASSVTLTERQLPEHRHNGITAKYNDGWVLTQWAGYGGKQSYGAAISVEFSSKENVKEGGFATTTTGSDEAHENMPPYKVVYAWRRTA